MNKFFVYYDYGLCQYGDHVCGLDEFDTLQLARARADELDARHGTHDGAAEVFEGRPVARQGVSDMVVFLMALVLVLATLAFIFWTMWSVAEREVRHKRAIIEGMAARIAVQSELLSRRAELPATPFKGVLEEAAKKQTEGLAAFTRWIEQTRAANAIREDAAGRA